MEDNKSQWQAMKPAELRTLAMKMSIPSLKYKKTVHGKNKDTLIDYLTAVIMDREFVPDPQLKERLAEMDKEVLIQYCRQFSDYRNSFDKKHRDFHVDFLLRKNVDTTVAPVVSSEENEKVKNLLTHKKEELIMMARKLPCYRPTLDRMGKEFIVNFILDKMGDENNEDAYMMMSIKELKELAMKNPLYNEKSFGKTKGDLISFLKNNDHGTVEPNDDEEGDAVSPMNLQEFFVQPDPQELRDALTKILTSHSANLV